ncbi:MAG: hypothetical protein U9N07_03115 [Euryarchaeota archaeon]|nr:hypothetical protein [Euryarchaeota archaeon]
MILLASGTAAADIIYRDQIDIRADSIDVKIAEIYTGGDAAIVQKEIADDRSAFIQRSRDNLAAWSTSYIIIDDDPSLLETQGIDVNVTNMSDCFVINSTLEYEILTPIDCGRHSIWIQGHPAIDERTIILPENTDMKSIAGIKDTRITKNSRIMITGASATRKFMNNTRTTFEYATVVVIDKKPVYAHPWFLPLLGAIEIALLGLWWMRRNH